MKLTDLTNNTPLMLGAAVIAGVAVWGALSAHKKATDALEPMSNAIGNMWARVSMALRGSHQIEATRGGFYLNDRYIDGDGQVSGVFINSISNMHPDNAKIFGIILTPEGFLRPAFYARIGTEITLEDVLQ